MGNKGTTTQLVCPTKTKEESRPACFTPSKFYSMIVAALKAFLLVYHFTLLKDIFLSDIRSIVREW
jgi:hypothetical protein